MKLMGANGVTNLGGIIYISQRFFLRVPNVPAISSSDFHWRGLARSRIRNLELRLCL